MKTDPRRFALLGLALSALAVLAFVVLLVIRGLSSTGIYQPSDPIILDRAIYICAGVFILGLALTAFLDPDRTRRFLAGRQAQYGSNAFIMLTAFLGILFFLNLLAYQNPKSWDLTEGQKNTLAPETISMLRALPQQVTARAYYSTRTDSIQARKLLENFKLNGSGKFSYDFIDPETNPVAAQQDGVDRDGTIVLRMVESKELVSFADEEGLDVALIKLINPEKRVIYFLTGHGEAEIEQADDTSYSLVKTALENKNYTVKSLNLGNANKVPVDAKTVIIPGPQTPLSDDEVKNLQSYLDQGGALIVMENPRALTKFGDTPDPLATLLTSWGITQQNNIIFDPNANPPLLVYSDPLNYGQHPITDKLRGVNSRFFTAQSLKLATAPQNITLTPLAKTYSEAWGETDIASIEGNQVSFDQSKDLPGPLILAVAAENSASKGRLVVFGDSEFAANALYKLGNGNILLNAVDWATQQEKLISLKPKNNTLRTYNPPGSTGLIGIILISLCIIPLLIIIGGFATWYSRRKRG
jgi:ABC-type uncharacterized transport system involved in gliding motility auxiliary subunit